MSHSITLAIDNQDSYHILCDNLLEKINEIKAKINDKNIEYTKLINSINEIKRNLSKKLGGYLICR